MAKYIKKIGKSYLTKDYYKYYVKENKNHVDFLLYKAILKKLAEKYTKELLEYHTVKFPLRMGYADLFYREAEVLKLPTGRHKINCPVNWGETRKLWNRDSEAKRLKTVIYSENRLVIKPSYKKKERSFRNQKHYNVRFREWILKEIFEKFIKFNFKEIKNG